MQALARDGVFQFEGFRFDLQSRVLFRRDEAGAFVPMAVGSRALDVLDVLLDRAGSLVLRDAFMAAVWPATAVEDTNLNMQIAAIRGSSTRQEPGEAASRPSQGAATGSPSR